MRIDLHSHSTASDGTEPPAEVVHRAREAGLDVLALTDHDTLAGLPAARRALPPGLALVTGMELSARRQRAAGGGEAGQGVVVGEREDVQAGLPGPAHHLGRRVRTIRGRAVAVQVDAHERSC